GNDLRSHPNAGRPLVRSRHAANGVSVWGADAWIEGSHRARDRRRQRHRRGDRPSPGGGGLHGRDLGHGCRGGGGRRRRPRGGRRAKPYNVDITDYDAVARAVESFEASFGPVSFLVNNAGWDRAVNFLDTAPDFWRKVVAINLFGPLNVTHVVLRGMAARGFGRVVNVASDAGRVGSSGEAVYSACQGGIIALTKTLARELGG